MQRFLFVLLLFVSAGLSRPVAAQSGAADGLPPRPTPFRFVNDQAQLMAPADAKKLESGLRRYADNTGTQVVVVTVPTLGGRDVADYGRALGSAWGVGQREKNNGVVVLVGAKEHKVTIQPGSGLASTITPAVTSRVIKQMTPNFKQGNYFAGLRTGLNTLMATANPSSAPKTNQAAAPNSPAAASVGAGAAAGATESNLATQTPASPNVPNDPVLTPPRTEPASSGIGMGTILLGVVVIGGGLWLVSRLFRRRDAALAAASGNAPDFLPNRNPAGNVARGPGNMPQGGNNLGGGGGFGGGGMGGPMGGGGGSGMGGILATGAAAAAGAYLGNRMASGHETSGNGLSGDGTSPQHFDPSTAAGAAGAGAAGTGAADNYFSSRDGGTGNADNAAPDYFSADDSADNSSSDYFSSDDNSSYDDTSSDDTGGGGFDSGSDNSGSW